MKVGSFYPPLTDWKLLWVHLKTENRETLISPPQSSFTQVHHFYFAFSFFLPTFFVCHQCLSVVVCLLFRAFCESFQGIFERFSWSKSLDSMCLIVLSTLNFVSFTFLIVLMIPSQSMALFSLQMFLTMMFSCYVRFLALKSASFYSLVWVIP